MGRENKVFDEFDYFICLVSSLIKYPFFTWSNNDDVMLKSIIKYIQYLINKKKKKADIKLMYMWIERKYNIQIKS